MVKYCYSIDVMEQTNFDIPLQVSVKISTYHSRGMSKFRQTPEGVCRNWFAPSHQSNSKILAYTVMAKFQHMLHVRSMSKLRHTLGGVCRNFDIHLKGYVEISSIWALQKKLMKPIEIQQIASKRPRNCVLRLG